MVGGDAMFHNETKHQHDVKRSSLNTNTSKLQYIYFSKIKTFIKSLNTNDWSGRFDHYHTCIHYLNYTISTTLSESVLDLKHNAWICRVLGPKISRCL